MNLYSNRRLNLLNKLGDNSAAIFFSGKAPMRSEDEAYDFSVDRNFYYLTGLDKEDMVLLLQNVGGIKRESLYILPFDEVLAKWVGGRLSSEEATQISGIKNVNDRSELNDDVASMMNRTRKSEGFKLYLDLWHYTFDQQTTQTSIYANELRNNYPSLDIKDIYPTMVSFRIKKDEYEIDCLRKAIHTTNLGIQKMMSTIRPNMNEMVVEGIFDLELRMNNCKQTSFPTIAASGQRATVLHYVDNNHEVKDGELFLCDLGATYNNYCADISRTFPVNGKFSDRQKEIYQIVLNAQKLVKDNARPGVKLGDLNKLVVDYYKEELPKHNLFEDVSQYYYHSVSHQLGLDTHDIGTDRDNVLEAGNVITDEPGLYIEDEAIGIRIEDDLLITEDGAEWLSQEIVKEVNDIEEFMNK